MSGGLKTTFEILGETANRSASEALAAAFANDRPAIREAALRAILRQRHAAAGREVVRRWHRLDDSLRAIVLENPRPLSNSMRDALRSSDLQLNDNALELAVATCDRQLLPPLVRMAENESHPRQAAGAAAVLTMVASVTDELHRLKQDAYIPGGKARSAELEIIRQHMIECLEKSIKRFSIHHCAQLVEAFVNLCGCHNPLLRQILRNSKDPGLQVIVNVLSESNQTGIVHGTLVGFLSSPDVPPAIYKVWANRGDVAFLSALGRTLCEKPSEVQRENLKRLANIRWFRGNLSNLLQLTGREQGGLVNVLKYATIDPADRYRVVQFLLLNGAVEAQREAADFLADFRSSAADRLAMRLVGHPDPFVQAAIVRQLRQRNIPGAMQTLLEALESEHSAVRTAAKSCFPEISIDRYLTSFDSLDATSRQKTGALVKKVDDATMPRIVEELQSNTRTRRLRALNVITAMGLIQELEAEVVKTLQDEDHFVRAEAASLLANCPSSNVRRALREALMDSSIAVRDAAERSLERIASLATAAQD